MWRFVLALLLVVIVGSIALGQLFEEHSSAGCLQHHYDELGNLTQTHLPDGRWLNRLYYGSGHLHQINLDGQVISDFERDRLHREVLRTQGQLSTRSEYDRSGRLRDQVRIFNSGVQAADAVLQGEVAAAYVTRAQAETALFRRQADAARVGLSQLGLPGLSDNGWPLGMAVKSSHRALATELEAALQRLRDKGELLAMFKQHGLTLTAP